MKTSWVPAGEGGNAEVQLQMYIEAVGEPGIETFHKDSIWQIAMSADAESEKSEIYYFELAKDGVI